uniref:FBA_2 domain-containing protein n=1 Tax=Steinernema glaseri TaxID=37863 RepID=A0A1I7Y2U8_9BILA
MDRVPYEFTRDVCNLLSIPTLDKLQNATSPSWSLSARRVRSRVSPVQLYVNINAATSAATYFFRGTEHNIDNWRIVKMAICDRKYETTDWNNMSAIEIPGGLHSDLFKRFLGLASIQCERLTIENANLDNIDFTVLMPRKMTILTIASCDPISDNSIFLDWFRRSEIFYNLLVLNIFDTYTINEVDLSDAFADILVNSNVYLFSEGRQEKALLAVTSKLVRRCVEAWMAHDHKQNRWCEISKSQFDLKTYDFEMKADLMNMFTKTSNGTYRCFGSTKKMKADLMNMFTKTSNGTYRCFGSTKKVYVETTDYFSPITFVAMLKEDNDNT